MDQLKESRRKQTKVEIQLEDIPERHLETSEYLIETPSNSYYNMSEQETREQRAKSKRIQQQLDQLEEFFGKDLKQVVHWKTSYKMSPISIQRTNVLPTTIRN